MREAAGEEILTSHVKNMKPARICPVTFQKGWLARCAILPVSLAP
jgi:hypothetical protein